MEASREESGGRGREATRPAEIPPRGWLDVAWRVKGQLAEDNVSLLAAGVGLFALLAAFPMLAALVSLYAIFPSSAEIGIHLAPLEGVIPGDALAIFEDQLGTIASQQDATLGIGVVIGFLVALWGARKGVAALILACNVAYDEGEKRGFFHRLVVSLVFTVGALFYFAITSLLAIAVPVLAEAVFGGGWLATVVAIARWLLLWLFVVLALGIVYRYAPARTPAKWRWVTWGSAIAATLWVGGGVLFEIYVRTFGTFGETYGALGGVAVLLLWLYLSGFVVILGAEINSELEHQTRRDSTVGAEKPMGQRGAYVADTLGPLRG